MQFWEHLQIGVDGLTNSVWWYDLLYFTVTVYSSAVYHQQSHDTEATIRINKKKKYFTLFLNCFSFIWSIIILVKTFNLQINCLQLTDMKCYF